MKSLTIMAFAAGLPVLASDESVAGTNNTVGAVRLLTFKGGTIKEKLRAFEATGHRYRYANIDSVLPFSHYSSTFVEAG